MHPVIWPEDLQLRGGEKIFFDAIKSSLREDDILICGLAFNYGGKDVEIDFLLLRKDYGFIIFEVKGSKIRFDTNKNDFMQFRTFWRKLDLHKQIMKEFHGFIAHIRDNSTSITIPSKNWSVVFTDTQIADPKSSAIPRKQIIDKVDLQDLSSKIDAIFPQNPINTNFNEWHKEVLQLLSGRTLDHIDNLRYHTNDFLSEIDNLTNTVVDQIDNLQTNRKIYVTGPAGSGKTYMALRLVRIWQEKGLRVAFLVRQNSLREFIKYSLERDGLDITWVGCVDDLRNIFMTRDIEGGKRARIQDWDALIIDEGQDFDEEIYAELEKDISEDCHIAIFSDRNQSFLKNGVQAAKKNSVLNPENNPLYSVYDLKRIIRSNAFIAKFATEFIEEKAEYKASSSFPIEIVIADSEAHLIETADRVVNELMEHKGWLRGEIALIRTDRNPTNIESEFSRKPRWDLLHLKNEIIATTSLGIKGLEREVAVVVINNYKGPSIVNKRKIYTAITRAKLKLVIVCTQIAADELFTGGTKSD